MSEADVILELPTFLVRLQKSKILIPNATVAEIIPYERLQRVQGTPDWFLGFLDWRGVQVPVASFQMLTIEKASFSLVSLSSVSLVVLRAIGGSGYFDYIAIVAQSLPTLMRSSEDQLFETGDQPERTELLRGRYLDEIISVPDFDYIEAEIQRVAFS